MPLNLYADPNSYHTKKILFTAALTGLDIQQSKGGAADSGKIPVLELEQGQCIFSTNAIARYVAAIRRDLALYGQNLTEAGQIDSWVEFSTHELEVPLGTWQLQKNGTPIPAEVVEAAKSDTQKALAILNNHLMTFTYMVGHRLSLADICLSCALADAMKSLFDAGFRQPYGNVVRWFNLISAQPEFQKVVGSISVAAVKPAAAAKTASPKASPKKDAAPKASPKGGKEAAPKKDAAPKASPKGGGGAPDEAAIKAIGDDLRVLKEKLKGEGVSGKKLNDHPEIQALVAKLSEAKAGGGGGAAPAPKKEAAPKKAAAPASPKAGGGADEDAIKKIGDDLRVLKEKLKGEGVSGKKMNDHPEIKALVEALTAAKAGGGGGGGGDKKADKKDGKKDDKKDDKAAEPVVDRKAVLKKVIKEGGKRGVEIEGAADMGGLQFFSTSVDEPQGDLEFLVESMKAMNNQPIPGDEERKGCSGHIGKMIFSAGTDQLAVVAYVPEEKQGELSCEEWLKAVLANFGGKVSDAKKDICQGYVKTDGNKNIFPLKIREPMLLESNNFLRKKGLFPEDKDSDDDDMVFGDDDFPS